MQVYGGFTLQPATPLVAALDRERVQTMHLDKDRGSHAACAAATPQKSLRVQRKT
jgi:hypothetical protein